MLVCLQLVSDGIFSLHVIRKICHHGSISIFRIMLSHTSVLILIDAESGVIHGILCPEYKILNRLSLKIYGTDGHQFLGFLVEKVDHCHRIRLGIQESVEIIAVRRIDRSSRLRRNRTEHGTISGIMIFVYVSEIGIDDIESGAGTKPRLDVRIDIVPDSELVEGRVLDNTL